MMNEEQKLENIARIRKQFFYDFRGVVGITQDLEDEVYFMRQDTDTGLVCVVLRNSRVFQEFVRDAFCSEAGDSIDKISERDTLGRNPFTGDVEIDYHVGSSYQYTFRVEGAVASQWYEKFGEECGL